MTIVDGYHAKQYEIAPEGLADAELTEVVDLGMVKSFDGETKPKVKIIWRLSSLNSRNFRHEIHQTLHASLHPRSALSQLIHDVTGQWPEAGVEFNLDKLLGAKLQVVIRHNYSESNQRTYANIASIVRPLSPAEQAEEQRVKEATARVLAEARRGHVVVQAASPKPVTKDAPFDSSDIPF